ncbi:hypothetical protein F5Y14DRAFT_44099 [Nemania sp. NC0429]|nr:hypothetical protein F5Y14DRAFT_44099 [Nemania sp. NC0429]
MPLQIPHPTTPLHLYRHLLRESTYLPALCRPWIASRIKDRFRDRRYRKPATPYVKQAYTSLRYLRSANAGHIGRLERLCFMATGRVGKRRRILATTQLAAPPPADTAEAEQSRIETVPQSAPSDHPVDAAAHSHPAASPWKKRDWLENWSLDMISALARSQVAQQASNWPQSMRRTLDTKKIERGTNVFGRPYNPKLLRNKLKKHWAGVLHQLLPPLPQGEWDHLASLVHGDANADELTIPRRRPVARPVRHSNHDLANEQWDWSQHVLKPARVIERGSNRRQKSLTGNEDQDPRGHGRPIGVRVIGSRKLQRIYGRIWNMSPIIKEGSGAKKWSVSWGENEQRISAPFKSDLSFFKGVTTDGKPLAEAPAPAKR